MLKSLIILLLITSITSPQSLCSSLNNPGCLRPINQMHGQIGFNKDGFARFHKEEDGIRAIRTVLLKYNKKHIFTVRKIVKRFTRGDKSSKVNYIYYLCAKLQVCPDDKIDLKDSIVEEKIITGIARWEANERLSSFQVKRALRD